MSRSIRLTPSGRLVTEAAADVETALDATAAAGFHAAFDTSSAHGLLWLASRGLDKTLPPALVFWREFAQRFFHAVCQRDADVQRKWKQLPPPHEHELQTLAAAVAAGRVGRSPSDRERFVRPNQSHQQARRRGTRGVDRHSARKPLGRFVVDL